MINHRLLSINHLQGWLTANSHIWLRPVVIIGVLLASAILPVMESETLYMAILAMPFLVAGAIIITRWPQLGFLGIMIGLLVPINGPSGFNLSMLLVAVLLGLWILDMMLRKREIKLLSSRTFLPLFILVFMATISFGIGLLPWYTFTQSAPLGAQLGGLAVYILSAAAFLLMAHLCDLRWLQWIVWVFLAVSSLYIIGQAVPPLTGTINPFFASGSTGSLFWTWLAALTFSQSLFNNKMKIGWRVAIGFLCIVTLYVAMRNEGWKSGWVPPLITVVAIIGFKFWKLSLILSPLGFIPASYLVAQTIATDQYSWGTRVDAWIIVLEIANVNPIFGVGFANYNWYAVLFPIRGYAVRFNSHMQYTDILAQTGIVGLICFIWFFVVVGWLAWRLKDRVPEGFARAYVYGALGGFVGTLVAGGLGDWVLPFFYNIGLTGFRASVLGWIFLGGLIILEQQYLVRPQTELEATKKVANKVKRENLVPPRKRNVYQNFR